MAALDANPGTYQTRQSKRCADRQDQPLLRKQNARLRRNKGVTDEKSYIAGQYCIVAGTWMREDDFMSGIPIRRAAQTSKVNADDRQGSGKQTAMTKNHADFVWRPAILNLFEP